MTSLHWYLCQPHPIIATAFLKTQLINHRLSFLIRHHQNYNVKRNIGALTVSGPSFQLNDRTISRYQEIGCKIQLQYMKIRASGGFFEYCFPEEGAPKRFHTNFWIKLVLVFMLFAIRMLNLLYVSILLPILLPSLLSTPAVRIIHDGLSFSFNEYFRTYDEANTIRHL